MIKKILRKIKSKNNRNRRIKQNRNNKRKLKKEKVISNRIEKTTTLQHKTHVLMNNNTSYIEKIYL